ncbi:MAG: transcriptional regulator MraZ [Spirochaetaceae bacterium]|nr:MAG: transcriptional regulator MraZ [Spirochaetaceae bacterium]
MITGQFQNALDDKGRLLIPSRIRGEITGNVLVITRGIDRCLWLFPPEHWRTLSDSLMGAASPFTKRARLLQRRIIAPAQEVEVDKAGRINIPQALATSVGLQRECVILGIKKYVEIWDVDAYDAYLDESEEEFQEAAEELGGLVSF